MLTLPKVKKGFKRTLTKLETAQKVVVGVALALGVTLSGIPAADANAATPAQSISRPVGVGGALLLTPPGGAGDVLSDHYSHSSHASHASHASHYSSSN